MSRSAPQLPGQMRRKINQRQLFICCTQSMCGCCVRACVRACVSVAATRCGRQSVRSSRQSGASCMSLWRLLLLPLLLLHVACPKWRRINQNAYASQARPGQGARALVRVTRNLTCLPIRSFICCLSLTDYVPSLSSARSIIIIAHTHTHTDRDKLK